MAQPPPVPTRSAPSAWLARIGMGGPLLAVLALAGLLGWHSLTDLDIWFHLRAGRDLLAGAGFTGTNTYAFLDADHPWINHEWLFQALAAGLAPPGPASPTLILTLNLLRLALVLAFTGVLLLGDGMWSRLRAARFSAAPVVLALAALAGLLLIWTRLNLRPELLSYLFFVLTVRAADAHYRRPTPPVPWRDPSLWRVGALVALWAQCHGFAVLGLVIVALRLALRPLDRQPRWPLPALVAPVVLAALALLATPNHWHGLIYPLRALTHLSAEQSDLTGTVTELVPLLSTPNALALTIVVFKLSLVWAGLVIGLTWPRPGALRVALVVAAAVAAAFLQRNLAFYGLAFVLLHGGLLRPGPAPWWQARRPALPALLSRSRPGLALAATAAVVGGCVWWAQAVVSSDFYLGEGVARRFGGGATPAVYPATAAGGLNRTTAGRTFANLDAAAYVLGNSEARVFIDGRTEAYPAARWAEHAQLRRGGSEALGRLAELRVSAVVLALNTGAFSALAASLLASPEWSLAGGDEGGLLFLPTGGQLAPESGPVLAAICDGLMAGLPADATRRADTCLALAEMYRLADRTEAGRRALQMGLAARPDHPALNHNLGLGLLADGELQGALEHFRTALAGNRRLAGSHLNAGVCELRLRRPQAAITSFSRAAELDPQLVGAWVNLAVALHGTGQTEAAVQSLERAVALRPDDTRLRAQLEQWRRGRP